MGSAACDGGDRRVGTAFPEAAASSYGACLTIQGARARGGWFPVGIEMFSLPAPFLRLASHDAKSGVPRPDSR